MRPMLRTSVFALCLLAVGIARAQEGIEMVPDTKIREITPHITGAIAQNLVGAGIKVDAVPDNAFGFKAESGALVLLPDRAFAAGTLAGAGEKTTPVGLLVLKHIVPIVQGQTPAADRLARLGPDGDAADVVVLFLGVRKAADGPVLEVYSKETKPLYQAPLKKLEAAANAPLCAGKIANVNKEQKQADLVLTFAGSAEATVRLGSPD